MKLCILCENPTTVKVEGWGRVCRKCLAKAARFKTDREKDKSTFDRCFGRV